MAGRGCEALTHFSSSLPPPASIVPSPPKPKRKRLGKNPEVDTSFLPDRDREVMPACHSRSHDQHVTSHDHHYLEHTYIPS